MQHNNWGKDRDLLSEAYNDIHDQAKVRPEEDIPPQHQDENIGVGEEPENEEGYGDSIFEKLEAIIEYHPQLAEYLRALLDEFEAIMTDINDLEAEDGKIDAADLGIHLNRLFPDITKGSAL